MNIFGWLQVIFYLTVLLALVKPLGSYMARVYGGERTFLHSVFRPMERIIYRAGGINPDTDMNWKQYAWALLLFNLFGFLAVFALQRWQSWLPLNPMGFGAVSPDSAFNTAVSFATNTNWQGYSGETTMSYLTQMLGLAVQNFLSAATGMAALVAFIRGLARSAAKGVGNFWADLVRSTLYILLPLSLVLALTLVSQGVVQSFKAYQPVLLLQSTTHEKPKLDAAGQPLKDAKGNPVTETVVVKEQLLPLGPAASQIAIKQLGTNGGGFFNTNSAHPFENPTPLTNFLEMLAILLIPASLCYTFGKMVGDTRQGWAVLAAMTLIFCVLLGVTLWSEHSQTPAMARIAGSGSAPDVLSPRGNMEGKEVRFGAVNSAIWATATTAASNGSVNSMHDSFMPLGGMVPMWLMQLGEVIYGGVGSGLYGMLVFAIIAVFIAGLMVGRTPEYLGKKIEAYEIKMSALIILIPVLAVLLGTATAVLLWHGTSSVQNPGPHGFSEILYAFSSAGNNNGSAFAGLGANTVFYNTSLGLAMLFARYWLTIPTLAIAGSLVLKKKVPASSGTLETHTPLFILWLIAVVIIFGALSFLPALALGPIVEHLLLY
ncbi:MAG: potassium-transporting ATPase subunit KdpA [Deltaproteobacteria bacterium RBG_13_51_10]|nr:MAG: potassium-transporting ATPase subunit KdpA [Deltaproteobacteria bacterium RBG_13_51_10]